MVVTAAVLATLLKDPLTKGFGWTFSEALKGTRNQKINNSLKNLSEQISEVTKVKTFYQIGESIDLHKFYVPTRINDISREIDCIYRVDSQSIVLEGTVGQGKSIFMRYLTYQEARQSKRVPVFFELRRLKVEQSLEEAISSTISNWIPMFSKEHFNKIAENGHLVLFLDGFDEVPYEKVQSLINEIEEWCERYPRMQIIISARPESDIQKSSYFKVYKLSSYTFPEQKKLIDKLISDKEIQGVLKKAIENSSIEIKLLLKTPLMVTLFVMQYKTTLAIPENQSEFYENLFYSLISRHDNTKAGFKRQLNSNLSTTNLQEVFEEFCFLSKNNEKLVLSQVESVKLITECLISQEIKANSQDVLKDFSTVVCLLLKDGLEYSFIHRSIQEYFYSNFINNKSVTVKEGFYSECAMNERFSSKLDNVLNFLEKSDTYNYYKFFNIPVIDQYIKFYQISHNHNLIIDNIYLHDANGEFCMPFIHMTDKVNSSSRFTELYIAPLMRYISNSVNKSDISSGYAMGYVDSLLTNRGSIKNSIDEVLFEELRLRSIIIGNKILEFKEDLEHYIIKKDGLNIDYSKFR